MDFLVFVGIFGINLPIFSVLSNKARYALRATSYLAGRDNGVPVQIAEIAHARSIPLKFLEAILLELRNAGILASKKGKGGGYLMAVDPATVSLAKVIRTIDGPIAMLSCASLYFYRECPNCDLKNCKLKLAIAEARDAILSVLEHRFLSDIVENQAADLV
jgi:Rrf2 family protein